MAYYFKSGSTISRRVFKCTEICGWRRPETHRQAGLGSPLGPEANRLRASEPERRSEIRTMSRSWVGSTTRNGRS